MELKKLSLFGRDLQLEKDYCNRYVSITSLIVTLFLVIATIIAGFFFGKEIYERKNPKIASTKAPINNEETKFFIEENPLMIFLEQKLQFTFLMKKSESY